MGADTESTSVEAMVSLGLLEHVLRFQSNAVEKSNRDHTEETSNETEKAEDIKDNDNNPEGNIMEKPLKGSAGL